MKESTKDKLFFGGIAGITAGVGTVVGGIAIMDFWKWFLLPIFPDINTPTIIQAIALSVFFFELPFLYIIKALLVSTPAREQLRAVLIQFGVIIGVYAFGIILKIMSNAIYG